MHFVVLSMKYLLKRKRTNSKESLFGMDWQMRLTSGTNPYTMRSLVIKVSTKAKVMESRERSKINE